QWEETVFPKCEKVPLVYLRYLDDVWGVWPHSREDFDQFLQVLNAHHTSIRVKAVLEECAIDFLDTTVYKGQGFQDTGILDTKVFFKETDTHALLHRQSYHPRHTFRGIVLSQLLRFRRICSQENSFQEAKRILFKALRGRGYRRSRLRAIYKEHCRSLDNQGPRPSQEEGVLVPAIFTFSPGAVELVRRIRNNFQGTLAGIPEGAAVNLRSAFRRNKSLGDLLVHSRLPEEVEVVGWRRIGRSRVIRASGGRGGFFLPKISLDTRNCIYGIRCTKCGKQYVGQTRNAIADRLYQHKYSIRKGMLTNKRSWLVEHFRRHGLQSLQIRGLEHNPRWTLKHRLYKEYLWIKKLDTQVPRGLNERWEVAGV
ncbi:MAG: GIY-YIG nuclease family protein, partial [Plesiomonas sp.]